MKRTNKEDPRKLDDWEWDTLVGAWRYYEHRSSITACMFPAEIVSRYWGGNWNKEDRHKIAYQFAFVDHQLRGMDGWEYNEDCLPWMKFLAFCKAYCIGFPTIRVRSDNGSTRMLEAFFCDDRWYSVDEYIAKPHIEIYINPDRIVEDAK